MRVLCTWWWWLGFTWAKVELVGDFAGPGARGRLWGTGVRGSGSPGALYRLVSCFPWSGGVWGRDMGIRRKWSGTFAFISASVSFLATMAKVIFLDGKLDTRLFFHANISFALLYLWRTKPILKYCSVSNYYFCDCSCQTLSIIYSHASSKLDRNCSYTESFSSNLVGFALRQKMISMEDCVFI